MELHTENPGSRAQQAELRSRNLELVSLGEAGARGVERVHLRDGTAAWVQKADGGQPATWSQGWNPRIQASLRKILASEGLVKGAR